MRTQAVTDGQTNRQGQRCTTPSRICRQRCAVTSVPRSATATTSEASSREAYHGCARPWRGHYVRCWLFFDNWPARASYIRKRCLRFWIPAESGWSCALGHTASLEPVEVRGRSVQHPPDRPVGQPGCFQTRHAERLVS